MPRLDPPFPPGPHDLGPCRLRPLTGDDAAQLGAALAAIEPWRTLDYGAAALRAYLERPDSALHRFAVEAGGALAGVLCLRHPWLRGPCIELLAVLRPGGGLGGAVMDWASRQAAAVAANLWATVSAFNEPARAFYRRQDFAEIAALPDLVRPGFTELLLRRRLG